MRQQIQRKLSPIYNAWTRGPSSLIRLTLDHPTVAPKRRADPCQCPRATRNNPLLVLGWPPADKPIFWKRMHYGPVHNGSETPILKRIPLASHPNPIPHINLSTNLKHAFATYETALQIPKHRLQWKTVKRTTKSAENTEHIATWIPRHDRYRETE